MSLNEKLYFALVLGIGMVLAVFAAPAFAQVSSQPPDPSSYGMTSARLVATLAALVALIGVIIGGLAFARPAGRLGSTGRFGAIVAGLVGAAVGGVVVSTSAGFGTGGGRAGAIVAVVLGLIAIALGGLALARSRRDG